MSSNKDSKENHEHEKLGQLKATAICGNDILSSALYVAGITIIFSGIYAPIILLSVAFVLYLYKKVYTEVVEALPINGGAYNCLLNGSSKTFAAIAGVMTILSYIATAVISAKVGIEYVSPIVESLMKNAFGIDFHINVIIATIFILAFFAILVINGLKDSANVAMGIFLFHIFCLITFLLLGAWYILSGQPTFFMQNLDYTNVKVSADGLIMTIYLAFSASLLGVSGFESSANFVEEQKKGVFRKTLRNMLTGVAIFNPLIAVVILFVVPATNIKPIQDFLLAFAAEKVGGQVFMTIMSVNALLVLSGAVLTAFVGVSGLAYRMTADGCLPSFLAKSNKKGSFPYIVITFFILCSSILIITNGNLLSLAGVYTIAFLCVMSSFALGNLILKETRSELKRTYHAPVLAVCIALIATVLGVLGNIRIDAQNLTYFEIYFLPALAIILSIIYSNHILRFILDHTSPNSSIHQFIARKFKDIVEGRFIVFIHNQNRIYNILDYIHRNESGQNIIFMHCHDDGENTEKLSEEIEEILQSLKKAGVFPNFSIQYNFINRPFGAEVIDEVSREFNVKKNRILIGSIHHHHQFDYSDLGGVRIIF